MRARRGMDTARPQGPAGRAHVWVYECFWTAVYSEGKVFSGWPLSPSPSRACQGLPWRGATLIAQSRAGSPIHGLGVEAAPCLGGATRLGWGRSGEKGERKNGKKGQKKRLVFVADGHAVCRLPGPLRVPPLAICVPPTHAEHTTLGGHPARSACTLGAHESSFARGA